MVVMVAEVKGAAGMIDVLPGILEKDLESINKKISQIRGLVDWIHIDVLDNTLIKNTTYNNWPDFKNITSEFNLEAHLMVSDPKKYIAEMAAIGFKRLIAHVETDLIREFILEARKFGIEIGVALDGPSSLDVIEPYLDQIDCVLVMMYKAGASGQAFQPEQLEKIKKIHNEYPHLPIEVDGGISNDNASAVKEAGATRLVSTSYLFWKNSNRIAEAISDLR